MSDTKFMAADTSTLHSREVANAFGVKLRPFTLWHMWMLRSMENPYAVGGTLTPEAIFEALSVCSMTRTGFATAVNRHIELVTAKYAIKYVSMSHEDRQRELEVISEYFKSQCDSVEFWEQEDYDPIKDRTRCPMEWHLVLKLLQNNICMTEDEAWNYPYARSMAWFAVINEQEGSRNYIDETDRQQIDMVNT